MMYNRYVPDAAGVYRPTRVEDVPPPPPVQPPAPPPVPEAPPEPPAPCPPLPVRQDAGGGLLSRLLPRSIDTGDLLVLLILLLLVLDGEQEDDLTALLAIAIYLFT